VVKRRSVEEHHILVYEYGYIDKNAKIVLVSSSIENTNLSLSMCKCPDFFDVISGLYWIVRLCRR
jgi:hypothetical protein